MFFLPWLCFLCPPGPPCARPVCTSVSPSSNAFRSSDKCLSASDSLKAETSISSPFRASLLFLTFSRPPFTKSLAAPLLCWALVLVIWVATRVFWWKVRLKKLIWMKSRLTLVQADTATKLGKTQPATTFETLCEHFPSYGQGIKETLRLLVHGCERRMRRTAASLHQLKKGNPSLCIRESKTNKMWSECLKRATFRISTSSHPLISINFYRHQRYTKLFNLSSSHPGGTLRGTGVQNFEGDAFGLVPNARLHAVLWWSVGRGLGTDRPKELDRCRWHCGGVGSG